LISTKHKRGQRHPALVQEDVLRDFGFRKVKLPAGPRPTYSEASERYGDCIVRAAKHWAATGRASCAISAMAGRTKVRFGARIWMARLARSP